MNNARIAALERRLARHVKFRQDAGIHVPALVAGDRSSPEWQAAFEWWNGCSLGVVTSEVEYCPECRCFRPSNHIHD